MAQVRQPPMRSIPDPGHLRASPSTDLRRSQSLRAFEPPLIPRSPFRTTQTQSIANPSSFTPATVPLRRFGSSSTLHQQTRYDSLTGLTRHGSEHETIPIPPPRSLENLLHHTEPTTTATTNLFEQNRLEQQLRETDELLDMHTLDDDDGLPIVSLENRNLPVYARFPFDVTFLPQPMETNVEDNIHRLRLRLIDSDLNNQRQSANDYAKRTQDQSSLPSSKTKEASSHYQTRPPSNSFAHQRATPKRMSRQGLYTPLPLTNPGLSAAFPRLSRGRVGMDYEPQSHAEIERDLEIRQMQESLYNGRSNHQPLLVSPYSYDPRLHAPTTTNVLERQYTSSNMDDLIDSMARRHLAYRRYDSSLDRQRMSSRGYLPLYESGISARQATLLNQYRHDDPLLTRATPSNPIEPGYLRSYPSDVNLHVQPRYSQPYRSHHDIDHTNLENPLRTNSYSKLPPITPTVDTHRYDRSTNVTNSALYRAKHQTRNEPLTNPPAIPLNLPDHTEHYIELPSDIFLTSRTDAVGSSQRQNVPHPVQPKPQPEPQQMPQTKPVPMHREKTGTTYDSEHEPVPPPVMIEMKNSPRSPQISKQDKSEQVDLSITGTDPFVKNPQKAKYQRKLFRKVALAVLFLRVLKRRATRTRLTRPAQTSSATIHKIRLQEIQVALHRVYLEPDGPIYNALVIAITSSIDLKDALNSSAVNHSAAIHIIGEALKNVFSKIVDFMPKDGVLGTTKTSAISALIQDGNPFPDNYFWQCERQRMEFRNNKIINITKQRAVLLLVGVFIFRSLITTLLLKPIKYRLMLGELSPKQASNLKVLASTIFYVGRRTAGFNSQILTLPQEWESLLYNDNDLKPLRQNNDMKPIMTKCELSLALWCEEYIRRIDASFGKELRS